MRNPFSRAGDLHRFLEDLGLHGFLAQHPLQFADLLEGIGQLGSGHHRFTGTDYREAAVLVEFAPVEQLVGIDAVAPGHHLDALPGLQALAHHGQFLLDAPAATPLLAEHFDAFVFS